MLVTPGNFLWDNIQDALYVLECSQALVHKDGEGSQGTVGAELRRVQWQTETDLLVSMLNSSSPEIWIDTADEEVEQGSSSFLWFCLTGQKGPSCLKDFTNSVSSLEPSLPQILLSSFPTSSPIFGFEPLSIPDGPAAIHGTFSTWCIASGFCPYHVLWHRAALMPTAAVAHSRGPIRLWTAVTGSSWFSTHAWRRKLSKSQEFP